MLWLTMSKVFLKSTNNTRTEPLLSRVLSHLCWIVIKACVVDLPGWQPYWFLSWKGSKDGMSLSLTMTSRTLVTVGRREIGRRSFWMEAGGWILGTGTTSADFHIRGEVERERSSVCIAHRHVYTPLMRFSLLARAVDRTAAVCSLQTQAPNTGWRTGRPGSPVSCTKVPTFRNPYKLLI